MTLFLFCMIMIGMFGLLCIFLLSEVKKESRKRGQTIDLYELPNGDYEVLHQFGDILILYDGRLQHWSVYNVDHNYEIEDGDILQKKNDVVRIISPLAPPEI